MWKRHTSSSFSLQLFYLGEQFQPTSEASILVLGGVIKKKKKKFFILLSTDSTPGVRKQINFFFSTAALLAAKHIYNFPFS